MHLWDATIEQHHKFALTVTASAATGSASLTARKPYKFEVKPLTEANRNGLMAIGCIAVVPSLCAFALVEFMIWPGVTSARRLGLTFK